MFASRPLNPEDHVPDWIAWTLLGLALLVLAGLAVVAVASRLRRADAQARSALAAFDLQLDRGARLLDDLGAEVRRVADHERGILAEAEAVRDLVPRVLRTDSVADRAAALARLEPVTTDLLAIVEAYPDVSGSPEHEAVRAEALAAQRDAAATAAAHDDEADRFNARLRRGPWRVAGVGPRELLVRRVPVVE